MADTSAERLAGIAKHRDYLKSNGFQEHLWREADDLLAMIEERDADLARLRAALRWRTVVVEPPEGEALVQVRREVEDEWARDIIARPWLTDTFQFWCSYGVMHAYRSADQWRPLPPSEETP